MSNVTRARNEKRFRRRGGIVSAIAMVVMIGLTHPAHASGSPFDGDPADWANFRHRFLSTDGRIVDTGNGGVTHSEGQGYGMLLAVRYDDRSSFDLMWRWTRKTLRRADDRLSAWRYNPNAAVPVSDTNNATDGDLFIAWALLRAGARWHEAAYTEDGEAVAADILHNCIVDYQGMKILAPGVFGFRHREGMVVNLSYYAFAPLRAMARAVPDPAWEKVEQDGLELMRQAHFGPWNLPPDWLLVAPDRSLSPADGWPARFSWDAVRIPLNLAWAGYDEPALKAAVAFWTSPNHPIPVPAWVTLNSAANISPYGAGAGVVGIMRIGVATLRGTRPDDFPRISEATDYYQSALLLLSRMAAAEQPVHIPMTAASNFRMVSSAHAATLEGADLEAPPRDPATVIEATSK